MVGDLLAGGVEAALALTAAILTVWLLRAPVRALFGARAAYAIWLIAPAAVLATMLPSRTVDAPLTAPPAAAVQSLTPADPAPIERWAAGDAPAAPAQIDLRAVLLGVWVLGAMAWVGVLNYRQARFTAMLGPLRRERRPEGWLFYARSDAVGPALVGGLKPRVVVPVDFEDRFSPEEQAMVIAHERVHLASGDAQVNLMVALAQAVFWFHPLAHVAARLIRIDQELACDAATVARFPQKLRTYAEAMLKTQLGPRPPRPWDAIGRPELNQLKLRLGLLGHAPGRLRRLAGGVVAGALATGVGFTAWAAQPPTVNPAAEDPAPDVRELVEAIQDDRTDRAKALILAGADVNARAMGEGSPLIIAARQGELEMVKWLLANGADVNMPVDGDGSPLIAASAAGDLAVVEALLAHGAAVDQIVFSDETALITAAREGHFEVVRRLVAAGADINLAVEAPRLDRREPERRSPLGVAQGGGHRAVADYLRSLGARA